MDIKCNLIGNELREWQQNQGKIINEEELKRKFQNKMNNAQGQHFEREIIAGCRIYRDKGIAEIDKTPEPYRVLKKDYDGTFKGRFTAHAQPDFQGTLATGKSIVFEAKQTLKDRIQRSVLTDTQMKILESHKKMGALTAVCVNIQHRFFFVPWTIWRNMKSIYGHQYITPSEIAEYEIKFDGAVRFLEYKNGQNVFELGEWQNEEYNT